MGGFFDPSSNQHFNFLVVYGNPKKKFKVVFLSNLVSRLTNESWLICGDLHLILKPAEKSGDMWHYSMQLKLKTIWGKFNLIELGLVGEKYSWPNLQMGKARIVARLDRACANLSGLLFLLALKSITLTRNSLIIFPSLSIQG